MSNTPQILSLSKTHTYLEKFDLMLGLMTAYNSYCINYYTLEPDLSHQAENPMDLFVNENTFDVMRKLEISQRFYFHTQVANFLGSTYNAECATRRIVDKLSCDAITNIKQCKIKNIDKHLGLVKALRNPYIHGKILPFHFVSTTHCGEQGLNTVFHIVIDRKYLLTLEKIEQKTREYLAESTERSIDLYDLFKRHFEFNIELYNSIRDEFLKFYVNDETTRLIHKNLCLQNGIELNFNIIRM